MTSKVKVAMPRGASGEIEKSQKHQNSIGRNVAYPTRNNAQQFQGQKVKVTRQIRPNANARIADATWLI